MSEEPVFDPRHDAVFQRGFRPGTTPRGRPAAEADAPAPARQKPAGASALAPDPGANRSASTTPDTLRQHLADLNAAESAAPPLAELAVTQLQEAPLVSPDKRSWINPFIIALWVIGPALAGGGFWLAVRMVNRPFAYNNNEMTADDVPWDAVYQQLVWSLSPTMIATGATTILGLLFWHAWQWRAARR